MIKQTHSLLMPQNNVNCTWIAKTYQKLSSLYFKDQTTPHWHTFNSHTYPQNLQQLELKFHFDLVTAHDVTARGFSIVLWTNFWFIKFISMVHVAPNWWPPTIYPSCSPFCAHELGKVCCYHGVAITLQIRFHQFWLAVPIRRCLWWDQDDTSSPPLLMWVKPKAAGQFPNQIWRPMVT